MVGSSHRFTSSKQALYNLSEGEMQQMPIIGNFFKHKIQFVLISSIIFAIAALGIYLNKDLFSSEPPTVVNVASIEKIIEVSELSTYTAVYNGIAEVRDEKNEKIDYYVSYESRIKAGIDFEAVAIKADDEAKKIHLNIPEVRITDTTVDIATLDYIFMDDRANKATVTETAYKAAEADVAAEAATQSPILELAKSNTERTLKALVQPFIAQNYPEYTLVLEGGGHE